MTPPAPASVYTDQPSPRQYCTPVRRTGYAWSCFADWRKAPGFVLEQPEYAGASIHVTGPNVGSGSSREHAPWGLQDWGFEAIIAPSFADIFHANCTKIGLLPVVLTEKEC